MKTKIRQIVHEKYDFIRVFEKFYFFIFVMIIGMLIQYLIVIIDLEFVFVKIFGYVMMALFGFVLILMCLLGIAWTAIFFIYCYEYYKYKKEKKKKDENKR